MSLFRTHRLLLCFVVLLFAAGHTHQVFGRFVAHHHDAHCSTHHDDGEEQDHHDSDGKTNADHMDQHASFAAVAPALIVPMIVVLHSVSLADVSVVEVPEAPVAGIDHPPQLIG